MFNKLHERVKNFYTKSLSEQEKSEFLALYASMNVTRSKLTAIAFIVLEAIMLIIYLVSKDHVMYKGIGDMYAWMYLAMLFTMIIFLFVFIRLGRDVEKHVKTIIRTGVFFSIFILAYCAGISLLDQLTNGQIIVYAIAIVALAVTPIFSPCLLLVIYMVIHVAFLVLLPSFQTSSELFFANCLNSTTFILMSWVISVMRYKQAIEEFLNKKLMLEKTQKLHDMNKELEEMNRKLEVLSRTDQLTGVFNRLMLEEKMKVEWNGCMKKSLPLTLIMVDIDSFKSYNDHYGHQKGDDIIIKVASCLSDCIAQTAGTVGRYGGDEFLLIIPDLDKDEAHDLADRIKVKVEEMAIPHLHAKASNHITVSAGVHSAVPKEDMTIRRFFHITDEALYKAKENRNCVCTA